MDRNILKLKSSAFTLIEILIVVSIIGILLTLVGFTFKGQLFKGKDAVRKTDLHKISIALEDYEKDHECYPDDLTYLVSDYMKVVPVDPTNRQDYVYAPQPDVGCHRWYWVFSDLEKEEDPKIEELKCHFGCGPAADDTEYNYYESSPNAPEPFYGFTEGYACCNGGCVITVVVNEQYQYQPGYVNLVDCEAHCESYNDCTKNF
ncbi:type II secretion system protein [Patescibacteria group bacterium]